MWGGGSDVPAALAWNEPVSNEPVRLEELPLKSGLASGQSGAIHTEHH